MPASAVWQVVLTNLQGQMPSGFGELLQVRDLKVTDPLMRVPQATFTLPLWSGYANTILNNDCLVKVYRTSAVDGSRRLMFHGPVVSAEENGEAGAQSIAVTAAGPLWRLSKRIIPGSDLPTDFRYPVSGELSLGTIAQWIITNVNGASMTGIKVGSLSGTIPTGVLATTPLKNAGEALTELAAGLNSFEFEIVPTEPEATGTWPYIGTMNVASSIGWVSRPNALFEYTGAGRGNVSTYQRTVSRDGMMTKGWIASADWQEPSTQHPLLVATADNETARGRFEDVVSDGGILDNTIRQTLLNEHIMVRKNPRQVIGFTCVPGARPSPIIDFNLGDFVRGRAVVRGSVRFDAMFRVWGITYSLVNGNEVIELELSPP